MMWLLGKMKAMKDSFVSMEKTSASTYIEHYNCKDIYKNVSLNYFNIIASCNTDSTRGNAKKNDDSDIAFPNDVDCEQQFEVSYLDGRRGEQLRLRELSKLLNLTVIL